MKIFKFKNIMDKFNAIFDTTSEITRNSEPDFETVSHELDSLYEEQARFN